MDIKEALDILKRRGHKIEDAPMLVQDGRVVYWIDEMPKTEKQILNYLLFGEEL